MEGVDFDALIACHPPMDENARTVEAASGPCASRRIHWGAKRMRASGGEAYFALAIEWRLSPGLQFLSEGDPDW